LLISSYTCNRIFNIYPIFTTKFSIETLRRKLIIQHACAPWLAEYCAVSAATIHKPYYRIRSDGHSKSKNCLTFLVILCVCPKAIISSRKSQLLQFELWDWDPGMGIENDDFLGRSVCALRHHVATFIAVFLLFFLWFLYLFNNFYCHRLWNSLLFIINPFNAMDAFWWQIFLFPQRPQRMSSKFIVALRTRQRSSSKSVVGVSFRYLFYILINKVCDYKNYL
jgi:hypothetical protein